VLLFFPTRRRGRRRLIFFSTTTDRLKSDASFVLLLSSSFETKQTQHQTFRVTEESCAVSRFYNSHACYHRATCSLLACHRRTLARCVHETQDTTTQNTDIINHLDHNYFLGNSVFSYPTACYCFLHYHTIGLYCI